MRFDERYLEDLKSQLRLSDIIGRTVKLRRQGREYVGLSPFSKEKTPSFYVNDEKGFYHDFSSGKHGDLISFLQETERLSFPEAVERLANEAGVPMPAQDPRAVQEERKRQGLADWLEIAARWFEAELRRPTGVEARAYLERRGLPESEWAKFRLGFAPEGRTALKDYLVAKGARPAELVESGLLIAPEEGGAPYDRFRGRIVFPITDARGRVISFGGRAMDPGARAKYLNGPETPLFSKSRIVYGLPGARRLLAGASECDQLVVVEGYMDVIACQRANVAAVAPLGTALTEEQMQLLWRYHEKPTLCFDGDSAGQRAVGRVIERILPLVQSGRSIQFSLLEGGKDPDEVLREQGSSALKAQLSKARPLVDVIFQREFQESQPLDTPEKRTQLKARLRLLAATIADAELSAEYREDLLTRYDIALHGQVTASTYGRRLSNQRWSNHKKKRDPSVSDVSPLAKAAANELHGSLKPLPAALLLAAVREPQLIAKRVDILDAQGLGDEQLDAIARELVSLWLDVDDLDENLLRYRLICKGHEEALLKLESSVGRLGMLMSKDGRAFEGIRSVWPIAFDLFQDIKRLDAALAGAVAEMERDNDSSTFMALKADRDAKKRIFDSGSWLSDPTAIPSRH